MKDSSDPQGDRDRVENNRHHSDGVAAAEPANPKTQKLATDLPADPGVIAGETVEQVGASTGEFPSEPPATRIDTGGRSALFVGAGILLSRIVGLIRQRIFAHYFGSSGVGDAFTAAFRIPNFLQNVFGEGALSASFIPVYAKLLAQGDEKEARRVANAIFGLLALVTAIIVILGVFGAPLIVTVIAAGFRDERRQLAIQLVRIFFPGAALLVLSAWCLGVLNSHHRFFISYTAPVAWNLSIIASLLFFGSRMDLAPLAVAVAWGSVIGSALQFGVQLPTVLGLLKRFRPQIDVASDHVLQVIRNFFPVFMSRGVVQISAFVDEFLATFLGHGAVVALTYAQSLYTLPVSLFGMSVSAAELPAMSKALGSEKVIADTLRQRLNRGLQRIAFFIVPSAVAFLALGDVIAAVLYQTGKFTRADSTYVWAILAGSSIGLLASTLGRLYSSTYYALRDTRTPLRYAIVRVVLTSILGYLCSIPLPALLAIDSRWGAAGLTASAGIAGWVEFILLRRALNRRIGQTGLRSSFVAKLWGAALAGTAVGWGFKLLLGPRHPFPVAVVVLGGYGVTYFGVTFGFGIEESKNVILRGLRLLRIVR
ncbi:MAG TPA: murein biosynthesis integral membrane protein MurJ [Pyrinomonadaceae bacterium]|nr:murein biosynthesis integral membrane protein MurJ [Pyrinomonadaceae bacterium]